MFKELVTKAQTFKTEGGFLAYYKEAFANAHGAVNVGTIAAECISILILIVVLVLIPVIGSAIEDNMPEPEIGSAWANYTEGGATTWGTISPMITVAVIVCIVGLVLKVIYDLKNR